MAKRRKILTTTIGSFVKPGYVPVRDWFESKKTLSLQGGVYDPRLYLPERKDAVETLVACGIRETVQFQDRLGLDILTDGEVRRENYMDFQCRHLEGIDFNKPLTKNLKTISASVLKDSYDASDHRPVIAELEFLS